MWEKLKSSDNWFTFLLVWAMVTLVALSIGGANLVKSIDMQPILLWTATLGVITGTALAKSRFPALTAAIYAIVYGSFAGGFLIGRTYDPAMLWRERVADLVIRQVEFFTKVFAGNTNRDALIFVVHTTLVIWILSVTAAWWTYRRPRPWMVILPSCLTMLSVIYYASPQLTWYLALFCLIALMYIAQTHLLDNKKVWQRSYVRYNRSITGNFVRSSLVVALLALAFVWRAPALPANAAVGDAVNRVNAPWRSVRDSWQRLYSALNAQASGTSDPYRDTLTLGGPRNPTDAPIMDVFVEEQLPYAYWRSTVLDSYDSDNGVWRVAEGDTITLYPDDPPIDVASTKARESFDQTFVNYIPNAGTIYAAPDLISSDRQILVKTDYDPNGKNVVSAARSRYLLQLNDRYVVTSQLSVADQTSLRNAGTDYPAHIVEQYTEVPEGITQRTKDLAADITTGVGNNYDRAIAIQNYLRNNISYNDKVDAPPSDVEAIDYFLFDSQEGYCNYYASSFAIMLRSIGIPTRLSRGFASGEYNEDNNLYRVRARDAHTWPEAYFPEYGWIQFEPTAIIEPVDRPLGADDGFERAPEFEPFDESGPLQNNLEDLNELFDEGLDEPVGDPTPFASVSTIQSLGAILALILAAVAIVVAGQMNKRVESTVDGSYGRLETWGRWLQLPLAASQTPNERAVLFIEALPEGGRSVQLLVREFVNRQFGPNKKSPFGMNTLAHWRVLRPILLKTGLQKRIFGRFRRSK